MITSVSALFNVCSVLKTGIKVPCLIECSQTINSHGVFFFPPLPAFNFTLNVPTNEGSHVRLILLKVLHYSLEHVTWYGTTAYTVIRLSVLSVFAAGENNLPHNYIQTVEDWCLCQAITSLEETGKLSEAEALCTKVYGIILADCGRIV